MRSSKNKNPCFDCLASEKENEEVCRTIRAILNKHNSVQVDLNDPGSIGTLTIEAMVEDKPIGAYGIEKVLFQNPATIVFWSDGTKTVVNCMDNVETKKKIVDGKEVIIRKPRKCDTYSKEAGLAMAIVKKWAGNNGNYNNIFRKFIPEMAEKEKAAKKAKKAQKAEK